MISKIILFGIVTIGLHFSTSIIVDWLKLGPAAESRFIERSQKLPNGEEFNPQKFKEWVSSNGKEARAYAFPVIFPIDLVFLICFGLFTLLGSVLLFEVLAITRIPWWLVIVAPIVYIVSDLAEDALAFVLLYSADAITPGRVDLLKALTATKFVSSGMSIVQTLLLALSAVWLRQ